MPNVSPKAQRRNARGCLKNYVYQDFGEFDIVKLQRTSFTESLTQLAITNIKVSPSLPVASCDLRVAADVRHQSLTSAVIPVDSQHSRPKAVRSTILSSRPYLSNHARLSWRVLATLNLYRDAARATIRTGREDT
eukprot:3679080-Pleurochrysis_carterae.AAC.2